MVWSVMSCHYSITHARDFSVRYAQVCISYSASHSLAPTTLLIYWPVCPKGHPE